MKITLKRILYILGTGAVAIISCKKMYGMPADIDYFKAVKIQTEENTPIKGLSVKLIHDKDTFPSENTNSEGVTTFDYPFYDSDTYFVLIEDIDGEENQGKFLTKSAELTEPDTTNVSMTKN